MNEEILYVTIPSTPQFFTLYSDGIEETITRTGSVSIINYPVDSVILLYYTFPTHRRVYCIRNKETGKMCELPGLSHSVTVLFKQFASRVDKTKKAISYLREHYQDYAYSLNDSFYYRLDILLQAKGKLDYYELDALCKRSIKIGCIGNA